MSDERELTVGAELWRPDGSEAVKALVEVERTDADEIAVQIEPVDGESLTGLYMTRAAAREVSRLIREAEKGEWSVGGGGGDE